MKQILKLIAILFIASGIFSSCKTHTNDLGKMIPNDAMAVIHVNGKSLSSKLSWDEIKQNAWFKECYNDSANKDWIKKLMDDPGNSGIDTKGDYIFFVNNIGGDNVRVVFEGDVKDAKAFEQFNKNAADNGTTAKDNNLSTINMKDEGVVTWSDKKFAYVFSFPNKTKNLMKFFDTTKPSKPVVDIAALTSLSKNLFNLKTDSSLAKNEKFTDLLKEEGDMQAWYNTSQAMKSIPMMGALSMLKLESLLDNTVTVTANFEDGKITIKRKLYPSKGLMDIMKKYGSDNMNAEMIKNIPSQNVDGVFAMHFKPEGISELIKLTGMDGLLNMGLISQGFTIDDFVKATKGDFMFSVTDLAIKKDTTSLYDHGKPDVDILFAVSIGDKASFDKIWGAALKMAKGKDSSVSFASNDKYFVIGNKKASVDKFLKGGNGSFAFLDKIKDHPTGLFVDLNKILTTISASEEIKDSSKKMMLDASLKLWENIYAMGGDVKSNYCSGTTEVNFVDKKKNSLKQLNSYINIGYTHMKEEKKKREEMLNDTTHRPQFHYQGP